MFGSAVIGGFILAMIEGTGILINRYSHLLMPPQGVEGDFHRSTNDNFELNLCFLFILEQAPMDVDKGKVDIQLPTIFNTPSGQSSTGSSHFS